jgi:hypothetical protein
MPADTKAKYYTWYMTDDPTQRIIAFQWWPEGEFISSMTFGKMYLITRDEPGDTWGPPKVIAEGMPWVVAQSLARGQGFNIEVAEKD